MQPTLLVHGGGESISPGLWPGSLRDPAGTQASTAHCPDGEFGWGSGRARPELHSCFVALCTLQVPTTRLGCRETKGSNVSPGTSVPQFPSL